MYSRSLERARIDCEKNYRGKEETNMPVKLTPQAAQEKHARRLKGALDDMRQGVQAVSVSPTAKAAAKGDKMIARLTASVQSGKWANRLNAVTLDQWKTSVINKGLPRVAAGIDAAAPKMIGVFDSLFQAENRILTNLEKMPDMTLEDSINRATTWMREMAKVKIS